MGMPESVPVGTNNDRDGVDDRAQRAVVFGLPFGKVHGTRQGWPRCHRGVSASPASIASVTVFCAGGSGHAQSEL
jgi:hypothetical protein